jgi:hypothetical protein
MIYQREREIQERQTFHRKQQLKDALVGGKNLPTELRRDAVKLGKDLQFDEAQVGEFAHFFRHRSTTELRRASRYLLACLSACYRTVFVDR